MIRQLHDWNQAAAWSIRIPVHESLVLTSCLEMLSDLFDFYWQKLEIQSVSVHSLGI